MGNLPKLQAEYSASCIYASPVGMLEITENRNGIMGIHFSSARETVKPDENALYLDQAIRQLDEYFEGERKTFDFPLSLNGSAFQKDIWQALMKVPYGHTVTYGQLAGLAGHPKAYRAAGSACHNNPVILAVPCHRVLASGNRLGGYNGGTDKKAYLLEHEGITWKKQ